MKLSLVTAVFLAAFGGAAHAEDADDIREASKAEAGTFNARMYAGAPGNKAYACFVRRYDAEHLARHPKQKVASMKLLISAEMDTEDKQLHNSFRLGCGVDCEGGGIGVALSKDDKSAIVRLARVRVWQNNKPDEDAELSLVAGADDGIFRLDRTDNKECASLVTDRKELAALRHK